MKEYLRGSNRKRLFYETEDLSLTAGSVRHWSMAMTGAGQAAATRSGRMRRTL